MEENQDKIYHLIETMYVEMKSGFKQLDTELRAEIQKTNDKMDKGFNRLETELRKTNAEIEVMKLDVRDLKEDVRDLKEDVRDLKEDVRDLKEDVKVLKHDLNGVKGTVLRIETDHGDKLRMLFDAYHTNEDHYHDLQQQLERKKII